MPNVLRLRECVMLPCCVGSRRIFALFGVQVGWVVELETVIAVEEGLSAEGGVSYCDELHREL